MHFANYIVLGLLIAFMLGALSFTKKAAPISSTDQGGGKRLCDVGAIPFTSIEDCRIHGQLMILICRVPPALEGTVNVSTLRWHVGDGSGGTIGGE